MKELFKIKNVILHLISNICEAKYITEQKDKPDTEKRHLQPPL